MTDFTKRLAQVVLDEYKVYPDYFQEKYCRFCGTHTKQQFTTRPNGQKDYETLWVHTDDCVVPPAEDFVRNSEGPKLLYRGHSPSTRGDGVAKIWMDELDESREYMRTHEVKPLPSEPEQQVTRLDILSLIHSQMHLAFICGQEDRQVENIYMDRIENALRALKP